MDSAAFEANLTLALKLVRVTRSIVWQANDLDDALRALTAGDECPLGRYAAALTVLRETVTELERAIAAHGLAK